ncbi:threonine ammonia-lyase [Rhizocola hellebori]|uniref:Threonine ammonia-lyase n=1 Tax=Rhizocola hellebori TaxID=1392758 RepID=A0A8J3Q5E6_9ACTN|nr:pyridoxal-phosphate dependent enzyme [Rhizocola hellebori]GIH03739.1 threonine ammonia-lyase [Rhizocola hellebori]
MLPTIEQIMAARGAIAGIAMRTPLVPLNAPVDGPQIFLKLENLQPTGSFKLRGAAALLADAKPEELAEGIVTASAGNMGKNAAWFARRLGVPCTVLVPPTAPEAKISAIQHLGAHVMKVSADDWWQAFETRRAEGVDGVFIHAFDDPAVMAGNGTIGLEIAEELADVSAVLVPWGGGGLSCGIATALRSVSPATKVFAAEVATAAPLHAALAAGLPVTVDFEPSFVDGIGSKTVLAPMYERAVELGIDALVAPVAEVAAALRTLLEHNRVLAEGAGATGVACALAAARDGRFGAGDTVVCVVSGGMIGLDTLAGLLA